jgi:hypothetical protein
MSRMTVPLPLSAFQRLPPPVATRLVDGVPAATDAVAAAGAATRGFLNHGWFAAALAAYGGRVRTLLATDDDGRRQRIALPL